MLKYAPSAIASCAVYLAQRSLRRAAPWNQLLVRCDTARARVALRRRAGVSDDGSSQGDGVLRGRPQNGGAGHVDGAEEGRNALAPGVRALALPPAVCGVCVCVLTAPRARAQAVRKKFSAAKFHEVATRAFIPFE